jgi:hypothetical protein
MGCQRDLRFSDGVPKNTTMRQVASPPCAKWFHGTFVAPSIAPARLLLWLLLWHLQGSFHGTFNALSMAPSRLLPWHLHGSFHGTFKAPSMAPSRLLPWHLQGSFHGTFMAPSMAPSWHLTHPKVPLRLHHPLPRLSKLTHFTYIGP